MAEETEEEDYEERRGGRLPLTQPDRKTRSRAGKRRARACACAPRFYGSLALPPSSSSALFFTFHVGWMSESIEEEATAWAPRREEGRGRPGRRPSLLLPSRPLPPPVFLPTSFVSLCCRCCGFGGGDSASFPSIFFPFLRSPRISFTVALVSVSVIRSMRHGGLFVKAIEEEGEGGHPTYD